MNALMVNEYSRTLLVPLLHSNFFLFSELADYLTCFFYFCFYLKKKGIFTVFLFSDSTISNWHFRVYNPHSGLDLLKVVTASKAQVLQRTGRAGREAPGVCYRLFTESEFNNMNTNTVPEIQRSA